MRSLDLTLHAYPCDEEREAHPKQETSTRYMLNQSLENLDKPNKSELVISFIIHGLSKTSAKMSVSSEEGKLMKDSIIQDNLHGTVLKHLRLVNLHIQE